MSQVPPVSRITVPSSFSTVNCESKIMGRVVRKVSDPKIWGGRVERDAYFTLILSSWVPPTTVYVYPTAL